MNPIPEKISHPNWEASTYKNEIEVSATNEKDARSICVMATIIATRNIPGSQTLFSPWSMNELTMCELVQENCIYERGIISPEILKL